MKEKDKENEILDEIRKLHEKINTLENKIDNSNKILFNHINFIHKVFEKLKSPLFFIMNKVNTIFLSIDKNNEFIEYK